jgi:diadenylate cyclase
VSDFIQGLFSDSGGIWTALLDLVIVYYLVYISLILVRGTRTVPMAVGLLLLVLLYTFSKQLGFVTTYMLLDQFMSVVVIFTLIIFQDDIRRALVRFGRIAWFSKARETAIVEEIVKASSMMMVKKIGALIVFEREAKIDEFILEQGTIIDGNITKELLYSIFIPMMENPLHDGAVIIRNYQIREAGSFLPLTTNPEIEKNLGTRHRAAIGITEQTDAVSIVVSEEKGTAAICYSGKIIDGLDAKGLREELLVIFAEESAESNMKSEDEIEAKAKAKAENVIAGNAETETSVESENDKNESK